LFSNREAINERVIIVKKVDQMSPTEANLEMNEKFNGKDKNKQDSTAPSYLQGAGTPAIRITGDEE
jgi:hypothetical protein